MKTGAPKPMGRRRAGNRILSSFSIGRNDARIARLISKVNFSGAPKMLQLRTRRRLAPPAAYTTHRHVVLPLVTVYKAFEKSSIRCHTLFGLSQMLAAAEATMADPLHVYGVVLKARAAAARL